MSYPKLCVFAAGFSGAAGGGGHQSSPDHHTHQLPLLHPGHAGGEDLQRHPALHRAADGRGSAAFFGQGQSGVRWFPVSDFKVLVKEVGGTRHMKLLKYKQY